MLIQSQIVNQGEGGAVVRRCVRCVMPQNYPGVSFDKAGVCSFCHYFEAHWSPWIGSVEERARSEARLRQIFDSAKRKNKDYDALVGISGGKDSSYCLYLCKEVYGLKVLTFTKDGGFLSDDARERIEQLVKIFDVPHIYCHDPLAPELSRIFMLKTGNFCAPCELSTFNLSAIVAREWDIPLLILGSSSRTEAGPPKSFNPWDPWYFRNVLKGEPYGERVRCSCYGRNYIILEGLARILGHRRIVLLPDYVEWDDDKISELFEQSFGLRFGEEHSDCVVSEVARYLYRRKLNGNDPRVGKYSLLIRSGKMSRGEALTKLHQAADNLRPPDLESFLRIMNMTSEQFEVARERSPGPYLTGLPQLFNELRKHVRRQAA